MDSRPKLLGWICVQSSYAQEAWALTGMGSCLTVASHQDGTQVKEEGQFNSYLKYPMVHEVRISLDAGMTDADFKSDGTDLHHPFPKNGLRPACLSCPSCGKKRNTEVGN